MDKITIEVRNNQHFIIYNNEIYVDKIYNKNSKKSICASCDIQKECFDRQDNFSSLIENYCDDMDKNAGYSRHFKRKN